MASTDQNTHRVNLVIPATLYEGALAAAELCGRSIPELLREGLRLRLIVAEAQRRGGHICVHEGDNHYGIMIP